MKRILPMLLAVLLLALGTGCNEQQPTSDTPGKKAAPYNVDRTVSK
jgi:hypothetical protein